MSRNLWHGLFALLLVTLACRPVIAIGWNEFLVALVLFALLLGPPIVRFIGRLGSTKRDQQKK